MRSPNKKENNFMETMIREYLSTFLRNVAAPLIAYLAASGYISESDATNLVVAIIAALVAVVWGLANKFLWKQRAESALAAPASTSTTKLDDIIAGK